jgi:PAS domain-containing protein
VHVIHLPGEDTATTRILLVIADLRTELALRESEQNLRRVLEHSPIPMASYRLNERREVLFVNREFTRTFGYILEEVTTVEQWEALAFPDPAYRKQSFPGGKKPWRGPTRSRAPFPRGNSGSFARMVVSAMWMSARPSWMTA